LLQERNVLIYIVILSELEVIKLVIIGPKVREFKPSHGRWISKGDKNPQHDFLQRESKAVSPMSKDFTACEV
jgi:hypothetical protein